MGSLSDSDRELLDRLGWTRGGEDDVTANYHRVFESEAGDELAARVAAELEHTLRLVYGAGEASRLSVAVITYDAQSEDAKSSEDRE